MLRYKVKLVFDSFQPMADPPLAEIIFFSQEGEMKKFLVVGLMIGLLLTTLSAWAKPKEIERWYDIRIYDGYLFEKPPLSQLYERVPNSQYQYMKFIYADKVNFDKIRDGILKMQNGYYKISPKGSESELFYCDFGKYEMKLNRSSWHTIEIRECIVLGSKTSEGVEIFELIENIRFFQRGQYGFSFIHNASEIKRY